MKSRCFHRTKSCLCRFLSPSCFYCMWAKLGIQYLSRALVKSFDSRYLEHKNTGLSLQHRLQTMENTYKVLEKAISMQVLCLLNVLTFEFISRDTSASMETAQICIQAQHCGAKPAGMKVLLNAARSQKGQVESLEATNGVNSSFTKVII